MVDGLMQNTPLLLKDLCDRAARVQPDNVIVTKIEGGYHRITWRDHQKRVYRLASALTRRGIRQGDRVGTLMYNGARHMQLYHAIPCMGSVLHAINIKLHPSEIGYIIEHASDRVICIDASLVPVLEQVDIRHMRSVELIIVCGSNERPGGWKCKVPIVTVDYDEFISRGEPYFEWPEFDENTAMGLCYTSGTTGKPKGVLYSHRSTYLHTFSICMGDNNGLTAASCALPIVPMYHVLSWGYPFAAMMLGMKFCLYSEWADPATVLNFCVDEQVTKSAGVPTIWQEIRRELTANPAKYKSKFKVNEVICGGSAPPGEMMVWYWQQWKVDFCQAWGMTETNPIGAVSRRHTKYRYKFESDEQKSKHVAKTGVCVPGLMMKIVDPDDFSKELPRDGVAKGELLIKGPWICKSYYRNPAPTKFYKGWLCTGDIASIDKDEYMIIRDRSKDLIKSGGEWISSVDMENYITGLHCVARAAVVGVPHPKWDERPIVICEKGEDLPDAEIKRKVLEFVKKKYAKFQVPDDVLCWDELLETSTRKLDKKGMRSKLKDLGYVLPSLRKKSKL